MPVMTEHLVLYGGPRHGRVMRQPDLPELVVMDEGDETRYGRTNMIFLSYQVWAADYLLPIQASHIDLEEFEDAIRRSQ